MSSFAVIICHGSYHTPEPYQKFMEGLQKRGIESYCPQLPSSDLSKMNIGDLSAPDYNRDPPPGGYPQPADDASVIRPLLKRLIEDEKKKIIMLGHSSGGFSATLASTYDFVAKTRRDRGQKGGIYGIFYACAFLIPRGESVHSFFQPKDGSPLVVPPYIEFHSRGMDGLASAKDAATYFFNDLSPADAQYYEKTMTASPVLTTPLDHDTYKQLPITYLLTENDMVLPAAYQQMMIDLYASFDADINVVKCPGGHEPHLGWTDGMVGEVIRFGEKLTAG